MHIISPSWPPLHDCFHFLVLPANIRDIPDIRPFSRYCWNLAFDSFVHVHVKNTCLVKLPSLNFRNTFNLCPLIPPSISLGLHHYIADHGQQKLFLEHDRPFFFSKVSAQSLFFHYYLRHYSRDISSDHLNYEKNAQSPSTGDICTKLCVKCRILRATILIK